ncbi:MAG: hypothetical protein EP318_19310 [Rhodobacteraceae bacterium]|nr:MAG: hypothetical protein EP318_19310 [Paracoccaceae bacterium]
MTRRKPRLGLITPLLVALATGAPAQTDPGDTPPAPGLPTPNEIIEGIDRGIRMVRRGEMEAAIKLLDQLNDITFETSYPTLAHHYPNLGQAIYYYHQRDWREVIRFASSVATGLMADGYPDHPYRLRASALQAGALRMQGRELEAEVILRNVVGIARDRRELFETYGLALFHLAMIASDLDLEDEDALTAEFQRNWSSDWPVTLEQALILEYRDINSDELRDDDLDRAIRRARNLVAATEAAEDMPLRRLAGFRGYLGLLLAQKGDYATAIDYLRKEYAYYREAGITGLDLDNNIVFLGLVLRYGESPEAGYQWFEDEVALARQTGTDPHQIARFLLEQAEIAEALGWTDEAQRLYRETYAEVRRVDRANHELAQRARQSIDLAHPGMADFAFASELGAIDAIQFDLAPDGKDVVRLFFEGNYLALDALLARYRDEGKAESLAYRINRALYLSLIGSYDAGLGELAEARRAARTTLGHDIPANALIFDMIEVIAKVWGTGHEPDTARGALDRLRAREGSMRPDERSMYRALLAFYHFRRDEMTEMRPILEAWFADYDPGRDKGMWDIYAATVIMEMAFGFMAEDDNNRLMQETMGVLDSYPGMSLARDYLRLVRTMNSRKGVFSDEALVELGTLVTSIGQSVPDGHSFLSSTQFALANAHGWRGNTEDSLFWLRKCVETMRATPYHRRDEIAYILARQADLLRIMGQTNEAHLLAQEALASVDPLTARPNLIGELFRVTAQTLYARTDNAQKATEFLDSVLDDPAIYRRIMPLDRVVLLRIKADFQANFAELPDILATLDAAEAEMDAPEVDWQMERSNVLWSRAIANYWNDAPEPGFAAMMESNDIYTEWLDSIRAAAGASGIDPTGFRERADWEALMGWDYAQTLPPEG